MTTTVEPTTLISEPGLYADIDEAVYHRDCVAGGSLSSTGARTLATKTAAHFRHEQQHGRPARTAFDIGRAVHTELLGTGMPVVDVEAYDWRSKATKDAAKAIRADGGTPLLTHQVEQVRAMVGAVRADPTAGKLFARQGRPELTVIARDPASGVMCRARIDWLPDAAPGQPVTIVDLKTCDDASPAGMARSMASYGYHQQAAFYIDALDWATDLDVPIRFVNAFVEKTPPYLVGFGEPDEQALAWGRHLNTYARALYRRCRDTHTWPGYEHRPVPLSLPGWQINAYERADDAGAYDTEGAA